MAKEPATTHHSHHGIHFALMALLAICVVGAVLIIFGFMPHAQLH